MKIERLNNSEARVVADPYVVMEAADHFKYRVPDYKHMPKFKSGLWDGYIRLVNQWTGSTYTGLIEEIEDWAIERGYMPAREEKKTQNIRAEIQEHIQNFKLKFQPLDFQLDALEEFFKDQRKIILSPTGSGKSYIIYLAARILESHGMKVLIVVPSKSLVEQLFSDFKDYAELDESWDARAKCHLIYEGAEKQTKKKIIISTWQSIYSQKQEYFSQWDAVIGDEVHELHSKAGENIFTGSVNAEFRMGVTGTLKDSKCDEMQLRAFIGKIKRVATTSDLQERKILADMRLQCLVLSHPKVAGSNSMTYQEEIEYLVELEPRNKFIADLSIKLPGNTLVLVNNRDSHAEPLFEYIRGKTDKPVYLVHGNIDVKRREEIRKRVDASNGCIIIATYGTYQRGINIVNLNNLVFGSPSKSIVRVLQSIGRVLRKKKDGSSAFVFDIADDLRAGRAASNHTLKHYIRRLEIYNAENFDVYIKEVRLPLL